MKTRLALCAMAKLVVEQNKDKTVKCSNENIIIRPSCFTC